MGASPNLPLSHLCLLNTSIGILSGYQCSSKQVRILVSNFKKSAPSPLVWPAVSVPSRPFEARRTEAYERPMTQQAAVLGFFQAWNCAGYTTGACMINAYFIALVCDRPFGGVSLETESSSWKRLVLTTLVRGDPLCRFPCLCSLEGR